MDLASLQASGKIRLVTGPRLAGKSMYCLEIVQAAQAEGYLARGVISLARFEQDCKTGIWAQDPGSGEKRLLASHRPGQHQGPRLGSWHFDQQTIAWVNRLLDAATPCDLLVIDELGPLEFEHGQGFRAAFAALDSRGYRLALVVVRPECLNQAIERWPEAEIITLPGVECDIT